MSISQRLPLFVTGDRLPLLSGDLSLLSVLVTEVQGVQKGEENHANASSEGDPRSFLELGRIGEDPGRDDTTGVGHDETPSNGSGATVVGQVVVRLPRSHARSGSVCTNGLEEKSTVGNVFVGGGEENSVTNNSDGSDEDNDNTTLLDAIGDDGGDDGNEESAGVGRNGEQLGTIGRVSEGVNDCGGTKKMESAKVQNEGGKMNNAQDRKPEKCDAVKEHSGCEEVKVGRGEGLEALRDGEFLARMLV